MGLSTAAKNTALDAITMTYLSLHDGDPGDNGANEISGGTPAYARKSVTIAAASGGARAQSDQPLFDVPASTTVSYVGIWDASTAGNYQGSGDVTDEVFASQGQYQVLTGNIDLNG